MAAQSSTVEDPGFISFLFSSKLKHDCFFLVGNENQAKPERIGVVKAMLMAHSEVLRLELEDSPIADRKEVALPDTSPNTFRILLRYVYGHDTTADLSFDDADNLLYVADKYLMGRLKQKLATRLMPLLNTENICSLLNNPACYTELELKSCITEILRYETDSVLASPLFLNLSSTGFVKILEQDGLNVPEIELWRAMMKWAKHNANTEDGKVLRNQVSSLTEHIRICTLDIRMFCREVVPTRVLTDGEVALVCISVGKQEKQSELTSLCNEVKPRVLLLKGQQVRQAEKNQFKLFISKIENEIQEQDFIKEISFTVVTKQRDIELLSLQCLEGLRNSVGCTTTITRITDPQNDPWRINKVTVKFDPTKSFARPSPRLGSQHHRVGFRRLKTTLTTRGHNVTLLANNTYLFKMVYDSPVEKHESRTIEYENGHLTLRLETVWNIHPDKLSYVVPMQCLVYNAKYT